MEKDETLTRAERAALNTYPPDMVKTMHGEFDANASARAFFIRGYAKAEERMELMHAILQCRAEIVEKAILARSEAEGSEYYKGKLEGYQQAIDLVTGSDESMKVELLR